MYVKPMPTATTIDVARAAQLFHALSDETRLDIIGMLESGERCVCELQDTLDAAQSRLSFHLRVLKDAGIVTDRREGRWSYYELNRDAFGEVEMILRELNPRARMRHRENRRIRVRGDECCG
jgi:ArsR family transcriptional regulator